MDWSKFLASKPTALASLADKWEEWADRVCISLALLGLLLFFSIQNGQFLCLAGSTAALAVLGVWRIWTALRDGIISVGRASFFFGCCAPLFIIYAALLWVQQYQGAYCPDKLKPDLVAVTCWILCCMVAAGPGGLLGTFIGYFFTGTGWTLFERASGRSVSCRNQATPTGMAVFAHQPFLKPKDMHFIVGLTAASTICCAVGIAVVLRLAASGYCSMGLLPTTVAQFKALEMDARRPAPPTPYRFADPLSAE